MLPAVARRLSTAPICLALLLFLLLVPNEAQAQQTRDETLTHRGTQRAYTVYVPASYDGQSPVPLMFNFHGFQQSAALQMNNGDMRAIADTAGFILVYPQGSLLGGATHWNVGSWTANSTEDDLGFTEAMIDTLAAAYNLDLDRVYSAGYSNGGYFSFELACKLSDRIAAVGSVAGSMSTETYTACNPTHPMPVIQIHGTADFVVRYTGGAPVGSKSIDEVLGYWAAHNRTDLTPTITALPDLNAADGSTVEHHAYEHGDLGTAVQHYKIDGGGHDWPTVGADPSQVNVDISASQLIWDFVAQYDLNGLIESPTATAAPVPVPEEIRVFPNPTSAALTVRGDLRTERPFRVYSVVGQVVLTGAVGAGQRRIDLSPLAPGVYLLQVGSQTRKVVKL